MPWIKRNEYCREPPARYAVSFWLYSFDESELGYAVGQRRETGQLREELLVFKRECEKRKDIDGARYFKLAAAELLKQYRGWDAAITWIEGKSGMDSWRHEIVSEPIAPYVDLAFGFIDLFSAKRLESTRSNPTVTQTGEP